jgi:hypothetical protein
MSAKSDCAPAGHTVEARGDARTLDASVAQQAAAGKTLAVWLYCIGVRSLKETQAAFFRHPEWRAA